MSIKGRECPNLRGDSSLKVYSDHSTSIVAGVGGSAANAVAQPATGECMSQSRLSPERTSKLKPSRCDCQGQAVAESHSTSRSSRPRSHLGCPIHDSFTVMGGMMRFLHLASFGSLGVSVVSDPRTGLVAGALGRFTSAPAGEPEARCRRDQASFFSSARLSCPRSHTSVSSIPVM